MRKKTYLDGLRLAVKVAETFAIAKDDGSFEDQAYWDACMDISKEIRKEIIRASRGDEFQVTRW